MILEFQFPNTIIQWNIKNTWTGSFEWFTATGKSRDLELFNIDIDLYPIVMDAQRDFPSRDLGWEGEGFIDNWISSYLY